MWTGEGTLPGEATSTPLRMTWGVEHSGQSRPVAGSVQWQTRLVLRNPSLPENNEQRTSGQIRETRYQRPREEKRRIIPEWGMGWGGWVAFSVAFSNQGERRSLQSPKQFGKVLKEVSFGSQTPSHGSNTACFSFSAAILICFCNALSAQMKPFSCIHL